MTPGEIARGLSKAQREALLYARGPDADGLTWFALGSARGLPVELKQRTVVGHCLTPLGLAVRAILEQESVVSEMTREHLNALVTADLALQDRAAQARSLECHAVAERSQHARERLSELAAMIEAKLEEKP